MNIKRTDISKLFLLCCLALTILSPALSNLLGLPRLDSALGGFFFLLSLLTLFFSQVEKDFLKHVIPLYGIFFFGFLSVINSFSAEKLIDLFFFGVVIFLFHYSFLSFKENNGTSSMRNVLLIISIIVLLGFFVEAGLGIQLVSGNEELTVEDNAFKGFFFNTNDQAVIAMSLSAAISYFFIIHSNPTKIKFVGYILLIMFGAVIIISASRSVLASYLLMMLLLLFLNASSYFKIIYAFIALVMLMFIFNLSWLEELFTQLSRIEWLERPIERFSLAIFSIDDDQSVGYRTEIYTTFLDNFKILFLGYGPRDYIAYFDEIKLSFPLGYTNPHSFFIEVYLAFGVFAFFLLVYFLLNAIIYTLNYRFLEMKQKIFALFIFCNFCWMVWVPSSILRLPLVWYPIILVLTYLILSKRGFLNNNE